MSDLIILEEEQLDKSTSQGNSDFSDDAIHEETGAKEVISLQEKINLFLIKFQNIKIKEKVIFYRLLSTMLNAGMPLLKGV